MRLISGASYGGQSIQSNKKVTLKNNIDIASGEGENNVYNNSNQDYQSEQRIFSKVLRAGKKSTQIPDFIFSPNQMSATKFKQSRNNIELNKTMQNLTLVSSTNSQLKRPMTQD